MTGDTAPRSEFEIVAAIRRAAGGSDAVGVRLGIGDDAAVLAPPVGHDLVFTTDLLVEGRHFVLVAGADAGHTPATAADVGWKALAVSVSDVAAMGARALWAVVSVGLPEGRSGAFADELTGGLMQCARRHGVALVGGDTTGTPGPLIVNVALVGCVPAGEAVSRSGARAGDAICVTGALGGSRAGRHLRPEPRQDEALSLVQRGAVHAMIDLSDGLSSDLGHVLDASGVGAALWADRIPLHDDARIAAGSSARTALEHALHDGEDFELLFTVAADRAAALERDGLVGTPVTCIGRIVEGDRYVLLPAQSSTEAGVPVSRRGHDHFRSA